MSSLNPQQLMELSPLQHCALVDLTPLARVGFRGRDAGKYLQGRGFVLPEVPNTAVTQPDGSQVARLSETEFLVLGATSDHGERVADEEARWEMDHSANYLLPRQDSHSWLQLRGVYITDVMAKLCGTDLRAQAFKPGAVAQTSAARINVIVVNASLHELPVFNILFDLASHSYFTAALRDAMTEFKGQTLAMDALS